MIRPCNIEDLRIWKELNVEFMRYEFEDDNVWQKPENLGDPADVFLEIIKNPNSPNRLYVIEENNKIIGFMNLVWFYSIWAHGKVIFIDDFYIKEAMQKKKIGSKALLELEEKLKEENFKRVQLMAEDTNPGAINFYNREGYSSQRINFFCKYL